MKKYNLYTERYVTDRTVYELPDDFDVEDFIQNHHPADLDLVEGVIVHDTEFNWSDYDSDWYRLDDEKGNSICEY